MFVQIEQRAKQQPICTLHQSNRPGFFLKSTSDESNQGQQKNQQHTVTHTWMPLVQLGEERMLLLFISLITIRAPQFDLYTAGDEPNFCSTCSIFVNRCSTGAALRFSIVQANFSTTVLQTCPRQQDTCGDYCQSQHLSGKYLEVEDVYITRACVILRPHLYFSLS